MELLKVEKTQALSLLPALRSGEMTALTKAVLSVKMPEVEATRERRLQLEKEVMDLRRAYRNAETEEQRALIAEQGQALVAIISSLPEYPPLRALARRRNDDAQGVTDELALLISWMNDQLNIKEKLTVDQIEMCAITIMQEYGHLLGMEDVAACFRQAMRGSYGQIYARLDVAVMLDWLDRYNTDLFRDRIHRAEARHANLKESAHDDRSMAGHDERLKNVAAMAKFMKGL